MAPPIAALPPGSCSSAHELKRESDDRADGVDGDGLSLDELLPWLEFGSWTALVLAPILYYVNGPSVSSDQAVVRTGLVIVAAAGAVTLRLIHWRRR